MKRFSGSAAALQPDPIGPPKEQLCATVMLSLAGNLMITPGVLYVKIKREIESDIISLPPGLKIFRRRERKAELWAIAGVAGVLGSHVLGEN